MDKLGEQAKTITACLLGPYFAVNEVYYVYC